MSELILFEDKGHREVALERAKRLADSGDRALYVRLEADYFIQDQVDQDIKGWQRPAEGFVDQTIAWLSAELPQQKVYPWTYRRHARMLAVQLLFLVQDASLPELKLGRVVLQDKWTEEAKIAYWRCIAICSAYWTERK